jgi:AcrR family transcriptional regulator
MAATVDTRERILTEALRLFARGGYRGTTIAEIEAAAGLSPGSGSLYAHFSSKEEVLEAAVRRAAALAEVGYSFYEVLPLGDLRAELTLLARGSLMVMDSWTDLIRVLWKEADQFPELLGDARQQILGRAQSWIGQWLAQQVKAGTIVEVDHDAVAVIALGSISNYWLQKKLVGWQPAGVDDDSFIESWVELLLRLRT